MQKLDISVPESSINDDARQLVDDYNKGLLQFDKKRIGAAFTAPCLFLSG